MAIAIELYKKIYTGEELENHLKQAKENVLKEAIEEKILLISAEKAKIEVTEEEIEKSLEEFKKEFPSDDEFYAQLKKEGLTLADFKEKTITRIKISKFIRFNIISNIRITEEEVADFYEENKASFLMPGQVKISQILIKDSADNETDKKIEEIFQKLKAGEDFSSLVRLYSEEPKAFGEENSDFVYLEQLQPQIRKTLSELKVGEFTKPILIGANYHIIKLEARKLPQYAPISEVNELIKRRLYNLKLEKAYEDWMENAKKYIDITVHTSF